MKSLIRRVLVGAAALMVVGSASPVRAAAPDPADLLVTVDSSKIAFSSNGKIFTAKIRNAGGTEITGFTLKIDGTALTKGVIEPIPPCVSAGVRSALCTFGDALLLPGGTLEVPVAVARDDRDSAKLGTLTFEVRAIDPADESDGTNNSSPVKVDVIEEGRGPDLIAIARDVHAAGGGARIKPGDEADLHIAVSNFGDFAVTSWQLITVLPKNVSFATPATQGCEHRNDGGMAKETCRFSSTLDFGIDEKIVRKVKVSADAPAPATLAGGVTIAEALETSEPISNGTAGATPANISQDIDAIDNADTFVAFTAGKPDGGNGGGGELPVTGASVGLFGGVGAAALMAGVLIVLIGRRRRV